MNSEAPQINGKSSPRTERSGTPSLIFSYISSKLISSGLTLGPPWPETALLPETRKPEPILPVTGRLSQFQLVAFITLYTPRCFGNLSGGRNTVTFRGAGSVVRRRPSSPPCVPSVFFLVFGALLPQPNPALNTGPRDDSPRPRALAALCLKVGLPYF